MTTRRKVFDAIKRLGDCGGSIAEISTSAKLNENTTRDSVAWLFHRGIIAAANSKIALTKKGHPRRVRSYRVIKDFGEDPVSPRRSSILLDELRRQANLLLELSRRAASEQLPNLKMKDRDEILAKLRSARANVRELMQRMEKAYVEESKSAIRIAGSLDSGQRSDGGLGGRATAIQSEASEGHRG